MSSQFPSVPSLSLVWSFSSLSFQPPFLPPPRHDDPRSSGLHSYEQSLIDCPRTNITRPWYRANACSALYGRDLERDVSVFFSRCLESRTKSFYRRRVVTTYNNAIRKYRITKMFGKMLPSSGFYARSIHRSRPNQDSFSIFQKNQDSSKKGRGEI